MNDKKLIFLDIDGTIWDMEGVIPPSAREAILKLKENGHIPILCTGRAKGNVRDPKLLDMGFDGIIAACGSHVEYNGKMLHEDFLSDDDAKKIVELALECNVPVILEGKEKHWIAPRGFERDGFVIRLIGEMGKDAVIFNGYTPDMKGNKFAGDILTSSDYARFKRELPAGLSIIDHELESLFCIEESESESDPLRVIGVFEGVLKGTSKARGMEILCNYLNVDIKDTYAVGDSINDLEMIEAAGVGIAMGGSPARVNELADYITDKIWDDGLYKAFEHFGLI